MDKTNITKQLLMMGIITNEFKPFFHQITKGGEMVGAETLARWESKHFKKIVSPYFFMDAINEDFEISMLFSKSMYQSLLRALRSFNERDFSGYLSFNLSASDLSPESSLPDYIISETPKELVKQIHLEVTQQHPIKFEHHEVSVQRVEALSNAGFNIIMDDMGSARGYNVFELLSDYVSGVKIDKSFADTISDPNGKELERPTAALKGLMAAIEKMTENEITYTLEGVEAGEQGVTQVAVLEREGLYDELQIQGFIGGEPIPEFKFIDKFLNGDS